MSHDGRDAPKTPRDAEDDWAAAVERALVAPALSPEDYDALVEARRRRAARLLLGDQVDIDRVTLTEDEVAEILGE